MTGNIVITRAQLRMERSIAHRADPLTGLRRTDRGGNKLVDVVNSLGFCVDVRSPLESAANNTPHSPKPGISVSHEEVANYPQHDPATGHWFVGKDRLIQRTIDTPDGPLSVARVVKPAVAEKLENRAAAASKVKRAPKSGGTASTKKPNSARRAANTGGSVREGSGPSMAEVRAYVKSKYGFTGKLTPEIARAARVAMEHARQVREYTADAKKK